MSLRHFTLAAAAASSVALAHAQSVELPPVVVTGNPLGNNPADVMSNVSVVGRTDLSNGGYNTLGDALLPLPGVSATDYGPNASRPIIRGLDSDRIRILQNGVGVMDVSALSPDHAVPVDPLVIDRIEVVRGPAALLYGGNAIGGTVNIFDNRIPQDPVKGVEGRAELRAGGAERQKAGAAVLDAGNGTFALHVDAFKRNTDDLRIPGYARSPQLRAQDPQPVEVTGHLPNSSSQSDGGAIGAAYTFGSGYAGLSYSGFNSDYGVVAEENVRIRMESQRTDLAGEIRDLDGFFSKVRARLSYTDYEHREIDAGEVATTFTNRGYEGLLEANHRSLGGFKGVIGLQGQNNKVQAVGDEALLPNIKNRAQALYIYEELPLDRLRFSVGGRIERANIDSAGGGPNDPNTGLPRFGNATERSFTPTSAAFGLSYALDSAYTLVGNLSHTERAPTYYELFANGPHAATGQYEIGNANLDIEKSKGLDLQLRWQKGHHSFNLGAFYTRFSNYITLFETGQNRDEDGLIDPAGEFAESEVRAVPADFAGMEAQGKFRLPVAIADVDLRVKADSVRASNRDTGEPLPRIAPWRAGLGLDYRQGALRASVDVLYAAAQNRVAENELPTDSYVQLDALMSWRMRSTLPDAELFLKASNLLNEDIRLHTSFIKDQAPLGARSLLIGIRSNF